MFWTLDYKLTPSQWQSIRVMILLQSFLGNFQNFRHLSYCLYIHFSRRVMFHLGIYTYLYRAFHSLKIIWRPKFIVDNSVNTIYYPGCGTAGPRRPWRCSPCCRPRPSPPSCSPPPPPTTPSRSSRYSEGSENPRPLASYFLLYSVTVTISWFIDHRFSNEAF